MAFPHDDFLLTNYTPILIVFFYNTIPFSFKEILLKLFISVERKYNKLQFGIRNSSIDVSKQKLCLSTSCHIYNKTCRRKSIMECLLSQERRDSECFSISIGVCAASLSRVSINSKSIMESLLSQERRDSEFQ